MSSIPQVVLNSIAYGAASGPYDGSSTTFSSDQLKGNGYYGYTDGLHTVSYKLTNFVGYIYFQATLLQNPTDSDWFNIKEYCKNFRQSIGCMMVMAIVFR